MLKRVLCLFFTFVSCLSCVGCGREAVHTTESVGLYTDEVAGFAFDSGIGQSYDEVFKTLGLSAERVTAHQFTGRYDISEKLQYCDTEFTPYLLFHMDAATPQTLLGGGYDCFLEDKGAPLTMLISALRTQFNERYGEPVTYPGHGSKLGDITDFTAYGTSPDNSMLIEVWRTESNTPDKRPCEVTLRIDFYERAGTPPAYVTVEYRVAAEERP